MKVAAPGAFEQAGMSVGQGGQLRLGLGDPVFADAVLADLHSLRRTAAGRALFRALDAAGCVVEVVKPDPPTDPPNAWTLRDEAAGGMISVVYDPADWSSEGEAGGLSSDVILFGRLHHALTLATGVAPALAEVAVTPALSAFVREKASSTTALTGKA